MYVPQPPTELYGVVYRTYDCDAYTREFLASQGIDVADPEPSPPDMYTQNRAIREHLARAGSAPLTRRNKLAESALYRFLEFDGTVLTFEASWEGVPYRVRYFLADDTVAVSAAKRPDLETPALLLKRTKVPQNWRDVPKEFPSAYLERGDAEVRRYYAPVDLKVRCVFSWDFFLLGFGSFSRCGNSYSRFRSTPG